MQICITRTVNIDSSKIHPYDPSLGQQRTNSPLANAPLSSVILSKQIPNARCWWKLYDAHVPSLKFEIQRGNVVLLGSLLVAGFS